MKRSLLLFLMGPLTASAAYLTSLPKASCGNQHTVFGGNAADLHDINAVVQLDDEGHEIRKNGKAVDPRGPLAEKGPQFSGDLKMSQEEVKEKQNAVRVLECGNNKGGTGIIIGNGGQIVTALHVAETEKHELKGPCFLRKPGNDPRHDVKVNLADMEPLDPIDENGKPIDVHGAKLVVIRLARRMTDEKGRSLGVPLSSGKPLKPKQKMVMISGYQLDLNGSPVGQECRGRLNTEDRGSISLGDCWLINSGSGSGGFIREKSHETPLVLNSIAVIGGTPEVDNIACDPDTGTGCSIIVNFTPAMIEKIRNFEARGGS